MEPEVSFLCDCKWNEAGVGVWHRNSGAGGVSKMVEGPLILSPVCYSAVGLVMRSRGRGLTRTRRHPSAVSIISTMDGFRRVALSATSRDQNWSGDQFPPPRKVLKQPSLDQPLMLENGDAYFTYRSRNAVVCIHESQSSPRGIYPTPRHHPPSPNHAMWIPGHANGLCRDETHGSAPQCSNYPVCS